MTDPGFPMDRALEVLRGRISGVPDIFLIMGSGLGGLATAIEEAVRIPFAEIPGFPLTGVAGHSGELVGGRLEGRPVLLQAGRLHLYEGHDPSVVVASIRLAARLGARHLVLTNAAGSLDPELSPGSILILDDVINLMARNPLWGPLQPGEERFPDLSTPFDRRLQELAAERAAFLGLDHSRGSYVGVLGPSYETPAEVRFLQKTGARAVGMSTVPEVIVARALGLRVLALSMITNMAAGLGGSRLDHEEVVVMGAKAGGRLLGLIRAVLPGFGSPGPGQTRSPRA